MGAIEDYRAILRRSIGGRPLVLTGGAVTPSLVAAARSLGSPKVLAVHEKAGLVGADGWSTFGAGNWRDALEGFDPLHEALALGNNWQRSPELAGRRFVGRRRSEWAVFEDKTEVGRLWGWAGLTCAPSVVVDASEEALRAAHRSLDQGQGTVWAGATTAMASTTADDTYGGCTTTSRRPQPPATPGLLATAYGSCRSWRASPVPSTGSWLTTGSPSSALSAWTSTGTIRPVASPSGRATCLGARVDGPNTRSERPLPPSAPSSSPASVTGVRSASTAS